MQFVKRIVIVMLIVITTLLAFGVVLAAPVGLWWGYDVWQDQKHTVSVEQNTPLFAGEGDADCGRSQSTTLAPGSNVRVRRIRYWKDCATINVTLSDGRFGYIVFNSNEVTVNPSLP